MAIRNDINNINLELTKKANKLETDEKISSLEKQKADQSFVDLQFANIVSGAPKGTYTTLAALNTAFPSGTEGVFLVVADGHWYYWNGSIWADGGLYQGVEVGNNTISKQKTTFINLSTNRFNKNDITIGKYYSNTGVIVENASFISPNPILVKPESTYKVNLTEFLHVCFFDSKMIYVSGIESGSWSGSFQVPPRATYVTFAIRSTVNLNYVMLVEGNVIPDTYIPYKDVLETNIHLSETAVKPLVQKSELGIEYSKNLFDKSKVRNGYEVYADGSIRSQGQSAITPDINVTGLSNIYLSGLPIYATGIDRQCYFYDKLGKLVGTMITISKSVSELSVPVPTGASYFVASLYQRKTSTEIINLDTVQVESGTNKTTYVAYKERLTKLSSAFVDISTDLKKEYVLETDLTKTPLKNLFDNTKVQTGYEIYSDGLVKAQANSATTDYINVYGLTDIYISGLPTYAEGLNNRQAQFYDINKQPLGSLVLINKSLTEIYISVPSGAYYFIASIYQRKTSSETINLNSLQIEKGTEKTSYEAYALGIKTIKGMQIAGTATSAPSPTVKTKGKALLAFGDSITETATISEDGLTYTEGTRSNWLSFSKSTLQIGTLWNYARSGASYKDQNIAGDIRKSLAQQITMAINANRPADIIVVACGTNDADINLGDYATAMSKTTLEELDRSLLYEAIRWAFWKLRINYPNATFYATTPLQRVSREPLPNLSNAIKQMANRYNFIVIDNEFECGIIRENASLYLPDGLHPNTAGQLLESRCIDAKIIATYNPV